MGEQPALFDNYTHAAGDLDFTDEDYCIYPEKTSSPVLRVLSPDVDFVASSLCSPYTLEDGAHPFGGSFSSGKDSHEAESGASPKVTFDPTSLIFADSTETGTSFNSTAETTESDGFEHSKDQSCSPRILRMPAPKVSFGSSNSFYAGDPGTQFDTSSIRKTPAATFPRICFKPSSLILKSDPLARNGAMNVVPESSSDLASESLESLNPVKQPSMVTFDPSSLLENLSSSSSDDELQLAPAVNTTFASDDQEVEKSNPSLEKGSQAAEKGSKITPSTGLRGILKYQKPLSAIEKIVADCLKLLCKTDDKHQARELIRSSISEVFKGLCFDQFFRKGECFSSNCDDNHHYKTHIFPHCKEELWNASLYIICHAATPNRHIVENLVQHYTAKENTIRALLFTKCVAKVKDSDRLELANFIVNKLSGTLPVRDVVTVILMLNFSELPCIRFNALMEGLRVFEQNTTNYSELMTFLNFHGHQMPARFVVKLMKDSMKYTSKDTIVEPISGFLKRLHPSQKDEVQPTANDFMEQFGVLPDYVSYEPPDKRMKILTKKVDFAADPDVREYEVTDCHRELHDDFEPPEGDFSDEDGQDDNLPDGPNFYGSSDLQTERIARVFGESCGTWILNGQCSDPVCRLTHDFNKESLAGLSPEDVYLAADFILTQSVGPSFEILKLFIEFLAESKAAAKILKFRYRTSKLSYKDSLSLTKLVISSLDKHLGRWEAIEKVLVPNVVELGNLEDNQQFSFDEELLCSIMSEAIESKTSVMRCVTRVIMQLASNLPPNENPEMDQIASAYIQKFVVTGRELSSPLDIPCTRIEQNSFASNLKVTLYQGAPSKYFLATIMMKQAISGSLRDQALDILYTFLLSNFDRARILTYLLENCTYFNAKTKSSVADLFGTVGLNTGIRLYENENYDGTAELFNVLRNFGLNIFTLPACHGNMTEFNLAIIYCSVTVDTIHRNDTIDIFLNRVVDPCLESARSASTPELKKLTAKMFRVFTTALLVEESLKLYKGIIFRQRSLVNPLNIVQFVEATFRCTFHQLTDDKVRKEILRLYLDVIECGTPINFQKVTHRSMFLITLKEITCASLISGEKGHIDILHPLMKKMLIRCIKEGVYHDIKTHPITMYSSLTAEEMRAYLLWWFALYVRGRKRGAIDYFSPVTINIIQEFIQDDSRLPLHHSLRNVNASITDCAERLASVIKNITGVPLSIIPSRGRGVVELHTFTVRALSQTALNLMFQHGYIKAETDRLCTGCFDKLQVELRNSL